MNVQYLRLCHGIYKHESFPDFSWFPKFLGHKNPEIITNYADFHISSKNIIKIEPWS